MPRHLPFSRALSGGLILLLTLWAGTAWGQLTVSIDGENLPCFNIPLGSATAVVTNGTAPYSYSWSNGETTETINGLDVGTYTVTVTDDDGLTGSASVTLTEPTAVTATITDPPECSAPFTIAAEPQGGTVPYTYRWSTGATTRAVKVNVGKYCVTILDNNLCGFVACKTVEENLPSVTLVDVDIRCNGDDDGSITATPSGGTPPYSYAWSNGGSGQTIANLAPGAYQVTLTDARGCEATASTSITEPPAITGSIFGDNSVCPGEADAFIRIAPSGGTPPYSYVWSPGGFTGQGVGPLPAGAYSVVVTDANDCAITRSFVITTSDAPEIEITGDRLLCGETATGSLSATPVSGPVNQYTYLWSTGATSPTITGVGPGDYSVTATDADGCTGTAMATVTTVVLDLDVTSTPVTCPGDADGTATASVTGGDTPYTYQWSNGGTTPTITGLSPGTYRVTVTEDNNCKVVGTVDVTAPPVLALQVTPDNVDCPGGTDGAIDLTVSGGTPAYTYAWSNGAVTEDLSGVGPGTYAVTVTDANGCTASTETTITEPDDLTLTPRITDVLCTGDATGSIFVSVSGGTPPYGYAWSNGGNTATISGLTAGDYTVTVTDANGCVAMATYTVDEPPVLTVTGTSTDVDCFGAAAGAIDVTASGGTGAYTYAWSNGTTDEDLSGVVAGTYTVTVTDANDCMATASFTIDQPDDLDLTATPTNVDCFGEDTGAIDLAVTGGTPPYTYLWSNTATSANLTGLVAGNYSVTVTDANGCTAMTTVGITEPPVLAVTGTVTPVDCDGAATGAIDVSVAGGTPAYTYAWSTGAVTQDIDGLAAGMYTLTVTDANNCMATETFAVTSAVALDITGIVTNIDCAGDATGSIDLSVGGGTPPYAYAWSNEAATQDLTNVPAGTYTVIVTDANGCADMAEFTITEPADLAVTTTAPTIVCGGTATGTVTAIPSGGTGPYTYLWSTGATTMAIENVGAGTYSVTVTDANGCTEEVTGITLGEIPQLTCVAAVTQEATTGDNGAVAVTVDGGTAPFTYLWSTGATADAISGLGAGTYSVTVTDASNCTTECSVTLRALAGLGDFVWEDFDVDGQQDPGEPGIFDYPVYLKDDSGTIIDSTRTDMDGRYAFMGLEPGTYSVLFINPPGGMRTLANVGDDATDSDGDPAMDGMTQTYTLAPGEFNMTVDAGFVAGPDGAITDPCNCLNNNTTDFDGQLSEVLDIVARPGQTWTILDREFMYDINSPAPPAPPVLLPIGTVIPQTELLPDDMAKYQLEFLLVDSFRYSVAVTNGVFVLEFTNQCFYPEVRYRELPPESICVFDAPIDLAGFGRLNGLELPGTTVFTVNGEVVEEFDPAALALGTYTIVAEFTPEDSEECIPILERDITVVEDCPAKIGDFVWQDNNGNGQQDAGEPGIGGVMVSVTNEDGTYNDVTSTDETGMYMFFVPPGTYKVTFEQPEGLEPTRRDAGDDETDSDIDPETLMTPFYTVGPDEMDLTIDAGFLNPCPENVNDPGEIAASQEICGPGNVPQPFTEVAPPVGGIGQIEFLWMYNTDDPNQDISYWTPIPNSNTAEYAPGPIFETTYFTRCVRRNDCPFIESNVLTISIGDDAVAEVSGPSVVCVDESATFEAVGAAGAAISWSFTGSSDVLNATGSSVTTSWGSFGNFSVTLTVTRSGCTSTQVYNVSVVNNPSRCGGSLTASAQVNSMQDRAVTVEWQVPADGTDYEFALERSTDGRTFTEVARVTEPAFVSTTAEATYRHDDVSPLAGRTQYRVRMLDHLNGDMVSNVVELQLAVEVGSFSRIFPNPAEGDVLHVEMTETVRADRPASIQVYDVRGTAVGTRRYLAVGTGILNVATEQLAPGLYFVAITVGDQTENHRVIIR